MEQELNLRMIMEQEAPDLKVQYTNSPAYGWNWKTCKVDGSNKKSVRAIAVMSYKVGETMEEGIVNLISRVREELDRGKHVVLYSISEIDPKLNEPMILARMSIIDNDLIYKR